VDQYRGSESLYVAVLKTSTCIQVKVYILKIYFLWYSLYLSLGWMDSFEPKSENTFVVNKYLDSRLNMKICTVEIHAAVRNLISVSKSACLSTKQ